MNLANVFIYSTIAGLSTMFGVFLVRRFQGWSQRNAIYLISFAVGVLLANAIFHLIPEAIVLSPKSWTYYVLAGILFLFIIEHVLTVHACVEPEECERHPLGTVSVIGIGLHSLIDGMVIGIGFEISQVLGILTAASVIAHEIPEGIFTYTLLKHSQFSDKTNLFLSWLVALATPIGTILTVLFIKNLPSSTLGILLALTAGTFIYIGASDLTPELHKKSNPWNIIIVFLGIFFVTLLARFLG